MSKQASRHHGGRPRVKASRKELKRLRGKGKTWRQIGQILGIGASTAFYLWRDGTTPRREREPVQKPRGGDLVGGFGSKDEGRKSKA